MSKLYMMNRMQMSPAAGGLFSGIVKLGAKLLGIGKKVAPVVVQAAKNPAVQMGAAVLGAEAAGALLAPSGSGGGSSGGWTRRRRRGITATELRGFRKVANLIHKEGMVSKRARGRH